MLIISLLHKDFITDASEQELHPRDCISGLSLPGSTWPSPARTVPSTFWWPHKADVTPNYPFRMRTPHTTHPRKRISSHFHSLARLLVSGSSFTGGSLSVLKRHNIMACHFGMCRKNILKSRRCFAVGFLLIAIMKLDLYSCKA